MWKRYRPGPGQLRERLRQWRFGKAKVGMVRMGESVSEIRKRGDDFISMPRDMKEEER